MDFCDPSNAGVTEHVMAVFRVNGEMIRTREIPRAVTAWTADGFDRIVFAPDLD
jgi:hypothetical protein